MRKPPKPRIKKPGLTWRWNKHRHAWEPYHRVTWTEGGKQRERNILLKWEGDAERLDALYWECEAGRHEKQAKPVKYSWRALITAWKSDPRVKVSPSTRKSYARDMDAILEKNAEKDVRDTTRQGVRKIHEGLAATPRKADKRLSVISLLWNYGKNKLDWPLGENPAEKIDKFGRQREYEPWPDWMVRAAEQAPDRLRRAIELILNTGQRPNAAITMKWDQFDGEWMKVTDEKGDEQYEVYCPPELRSILPTWGKSGAHIIAKNLSEPVGYDAIQKDFSRWRARLDKQTDGKAKPYVLHGLRKLAIVRLAEGGATDAEIQAITNQSAETVAYYRKRASRKALSRNAQNRTKTKRDSVSGGCE